MSTAVVVLVVDVVVAVAVAVAAMATLFYYYLLLDLFNRIYYHVVIACPRPSRSLLFCGLWRGMAAGGETLRRQTDGIPIRGGDEWARKGGWRGGRGQLKSGCPPVSLIWVRSREHEPTKKKVPSSQESV